MASKQDKFFFGNLIRAAESSCRSAAYLVSCLEAFEVSRMGDMLETMHGYEHQGDETRHEMSAALARAFVTPVDREDLDLLSHNIDDVTDCVEDVLQTIYVNHITAIPDSIRDFAGLISRACTVMKEMLEEFENFKRPARLHELVIRLSDLEEEGDRMYLQMKYDLLRGEPDVLAVISWREILDKMENCLDTCEHVGDCVGTVVMKNS